MANSKPEAFGLKIPSKADKRKSLILDSLRILTWQNYKAENRISGLDGYAEFDVAWKAMDIHSQDLPQLLELLKQLDYTEAELMAMRQKYYRLRSGDRNDFVPEGEEIPY
ncbi:MAG TPA: hypothetical protein IGS17_00555 [Oscillatoriales cyanobacterium M59_W2019_021]|nr:MAG: hypothetical protein D6728_07515 [Cyanobacteria bacterium J055]HIK29891.1 hypothetical protein [Oscillatoriales cyanobacterium M4454_W2019_049]HIK49407.1 hypothetical protein [Oscillatoriales cyanobacterium M59_W2019_021]